MNLTTKEVDGSRELMSKTKAATGQRWSDLHSSHLTLEVRTLPGDLQGQVLTADCVSWNSCLPSTPVFPLF